MDETQLLIPDSSEWVGVWVTKSLQIINLHTELNYI